ncbi:MAG TPA: TQO small subunit DoxD [Solirubrobacteraceae bacterium]
MSSSWLNRFDGLRSLDPRAALLPLRAFLGITFVYAGVQKLSDPGYLHGGAPTYLGTQLRGFANGTPGGFILKTFAIPHITLSGVGIAFVEIAIGLFVLVGLFTRLAAAVGLLLNLLLFLTASWKTYPYFLGSDIVFVFAWLPFVLAGSTGQPAVEHVLARRARDTRRPARREPGAALPAGAAAVATRRELLVRAAGLTGAATLLLGGFAALAKGRYRPRTSALASGGGSATPAPAPTHPTTTPSQPGAAEARLPPNAVRLGPASQLGADQSALYREPSDGSPDIIIRHGNGTLTALSAVCTHAGCTVGYQGGEIVCPCHGATFDPQTGAVTGGPAPAPLARRRVTENGGNIYAFPS